MSGEVALVVVVVVVLVSSGFCEIVVADRDELLHRCVLRELQEVELEW